MKPKKRFYSIIKTYYYVIEAQGIMSSIDNDKNSDKSSEDEKDRKSSEKIDFSKEINNWGLLITKHPLRFKIWTILQLYGKLNVTQISKLVKESKSTVSRIANEMEDDFLITSDTTESEIRGRIASKNYHIDFKLLNEKLDKRQVPHDPMQRIDYYRERLNEDISAIKIFKYTLSLLEPLLNYFKDSLGDDNDDEKPADIKMADSIYKKFFQGKLEPMYYFKYLCEYELTHLNELWNHGWEKDKDKIAKEKKKGKGNTHSYFTLQLPLKALFELNEKLENK
ncbi:MAG: hypothetical protein ACTSWY_04865 [Promethearchaeota archaeon]